MSQFHLRKSLGFAPLLGLVAMALSTTSCAQSEASRLDAQPAAVMQAIRDYGRGHQALLVPGSTEKSDQPEQAYCAQVRNILVQEDFSQLEKIAQQNRVEKGRLLGGVWKIWAFYCGTSWPVDAGKPNESEWQGQISRLNNWIAAYPNSAATHLSLAYLYINYSWNARGSGFADSVTDAQWKLFHEGNAKAKAILLEASSLKNKDPFWYELMQVVAHNEGWAQAEAREVFDQAVAFEPGYYHYYVEYDRYLQPQWYGKPGDVLAFAKEISSKVSEPDGSMFYFWIMSSRACYCKDAMQDLPQASYPKLQAGYNSIARLYGVSNLNANRFAYMATTFMDKAAAGNAFASVTKMDEDIWSYQSVFDNSREWATAP
jgi:hypothetical protein